MVPEAYREYKQYGSGVIPPISSYIESDTSNIWNSKRMIYDESVILDIHRKMIAEVVDTFSEYSAAALVTLTHDQSPWMDAYVPHQNNEITIESMRKYFDE